MGRLVTQSALTQYLLKRYLRAVTETDNGLLARAARFAALADPGRLHLVDLLCLGDRSPGELTELTGMPGNLLAHHLRVLETAGLLRRSRSEGDARRTYVRLANGPDVLALLAPGGVGGHRLVVRRVVFLCTHNTARSHLAAAAWAETSAVPVASAGTAPAAAVHPEAAAAARRAGLDLRGRRTAHVDDVLRPGDLVVAVCDNAYEHRARAATAPAVHWAVADPVRIATPAAFDDALTDLTARVSRLAPAVTT